MKKYALFAQNLKDRNPGYQGSLLFFDDISEMREQLLLIDETYETNADLDSVDDFCRGLNINHIDEDYAEKMQHLLGDDCKILYIGKTLDLAKIENEFAGVLRAEFRGELEDPSPEYMEPISRTDHREFLRFLEHWRAEESEFE